MTSQQPILIVEDSDDDYEATERALLRNDSLHEPLVRCLNGQDALDYCFQQGKYILPAHAPRPKLVLLDLNMPGIDGREALRQLKSNERLKSVPIIVLTTSNAPADIETCYQLGANCYVHKPVELDAFYEAVGNIKKFWLGTALLPEQG